MTTEPRGNERQCSSCIGLSFCVLSTVSPEVLHLASLSSRQLTFNPGDTIFQGETLAPGWVILCHGKARLYLRMHDGKQLLLRFCRPGDLLADPTRGAVPYAASAVTPARVAFLSENDVAGLIQAHPEVLAEVTRRLAQERKWLLRRLVDFAYGSTRGRLARVLLELGEEHGVAEDGEVRIDLPLSLSDLAAMIGASRQATSKELQFLRQKRLIRLRWPWITLTNKADSGEGCFPFRMDHFPNRSFAPYVRLYGAFYPFKGQKWLSRTIDWAVQN